MTPKLVVLTGYPTCGKSTVSEFLALDMGYTRLSSEDISIELFKHSYPYADDENPERIWETIHQRRDELLGEGKDVVVDTTAYSEQRRRYLFDTPMQTEKYLVWLQVKPKTMKSRMKGRQWPEDSIEKWKKVVWWEDPRQNGYKLIVYQNNTPEDLEHIKADLRRQLT